MNQEIKDEIDTVLYEMRKLSQPMRKMLAGYFLEAAEAELGRGFIADIQHILNEREEKGSW
jgi:hypothetical protein